MAQRIVRAHRRAKRRERPLGAAIGWGLAVTFGVGLIILLVQLAVPGSVAAHFFLLASRAPSPTLRVDPLFQQYAESLQEQEALFATPFSLLCGGLTLGRLAPGYLTRRRLLLSGAAMAFGVVAVSLAFTWPAAVIGQNRINQQAGGDIYAVTAPPDLIVRQALWACVWVVVGTFGTWLGRRGRDRRAADPAGLGAARR